MAAAPLGLERQVQDHFAAARDRRAATRRRCGPERNHGDRDRRLERQHALGRVQTVTEVVDDDRDPRPPCGRQARSPRLGGSRRSVPP